MPQCIGQDKSAVQIPYANASQRGHRGGLLFDRCRVASRVRPPERIPSPTLHKSCSTVRNNAQGMLSDNIRPLTARAHFSRPPRCCGAWLCHGTVTDRSESCHKHKAPISAGPIPAVTRHIATRVPSLKNPYKSIGYSHIPKSYKHITN